MFNLSADTLTYTTCPVLSGDVIYYVIEGEGVGIEIAGWIVPNDLYILSNLIDGIVKGGDILVDIGVYEGLSTSAIAATCRDLTPPVKVYGIDIWKEGSVSPGKIKRTMQESRKVFLDIMKYFSCFVFEKDSTEAALWFDDDSVAFVFIDGDHSSHKVLADVNAWWPKVRTGGMLAGHDATNLGVIQALAAFPPAKDKRSFRDLWWIRK